MARGNFRKQLTDRIVEFLGENDSLPRQPESGNFRPFNPVTGARYRGGNVINLIHGALERDSDDPRWMTLKQANSAGYRVKKGAKGELVEYWDWGHLKSRSDESQPRRGELRERPESLHGKNDDSTEATVPAAASQPLLQDTPPSPNVRDELLTVRQRIPKTPSTAVPALVGEEQDEPRRPLVFYAVVFNGNDIVGLPELTRTLTWKPTEVADKLIAATGAQIEYPAGRPAARRKDARGAAYFDETADKIVLPSPDSFKTRADFYASALRQLAHWTGHESRLGRLKGAAPGTPEYGEEELRAEIAGMFLTAMLGLEGTAQGVSAYASRWIEKLKKDKHEIFRAARDAEKIVDHLFEYAPELKAVLDSRMQDNILREGPKKKIDSGIAALPNFIPHVAAGLLAHTGRHDPRWGAFEGAVRSESRKYGIAEGAIEQTFGLLVPKFSDVMNAANRNGYTVDDMQAMLVRQLVEEMRLHNLREQQWTRFSDQVREAAKDLMDPKLVELELQSLSQKYQQVLQLSVQEGWDKERTDLAVRETIFGERGRRSITPDYIQQTFLAETRPALAADPDDDLILMPLAGGFSIEDAMPADAAAVSDEQLDSRIH